MSRLPLIAALTSALALSACGADPGAVCERAYAHLTEIAKRRPDPALAERFIEACHASGDYGRAACLLEATTPGEALACKPRKKRPG